MTVRPRVPHSDLPKWRRGDGRDRLRNHLSAESIYEREVGDVTQVIERVFVRGSETNAYQRPSYRFLEIFDGEPENVALADTLREARARADSRAKRWI